jgi:SAM-dependent methyltransferase
MTDATADQVRRYVLDGSDEDLRRLLSLSESFAEQARRAFRRAGVGPGWTVIDCGCGPVGALALLAELVGPTGRVVGVDFSEPTIQRARSVVMAAGLDNVDLFAGDIHDLDAAALGGPFDLAFTRAFLMHQQDPARTLSFEIHASTLAAARERAITAGVAAETIDDLVATLRAAKSGGYEWVTSPFLLDLVLRKPASAR